MRFRKLFSALLLLGACAILMPLMSTCGGGSGEDFSDSGQTNAKKKDLIGFWSCYAEKWVEDGEKDGIEYDEWEDDPYAHYIWLDSDGSGTIHEVLECNPGGSFSWHISDGKLYAGSRGPFIINSVSSDRLVLTWDDDDFKVTGYFNKLWGGSDIYDDDEDDDYDDEPQDNPWNSIH